MTTPKTVEYIDRMGRHHLCNLMDGDFAELTLPDGTFLDVRFDGDNTLRLAHHEKTWRLEDISISEV